MSSPVGAELRRAIPFCRRIHLTGYPMRLPRRPTDASSPAPVARLPARSHRCSLQTPDPVARPGDPQPSVRPPRSPGSASPMPRRLPRRFTGGGRISSYLPRFPPREPGWPSTSPRPPLLAAAVRWHRSSCSGWRCADRYAAHFACPPIPGQEVLLDFTGLSTNIPGYPQNFFVRPPFTHKLFTRRALFEGARTPIALTPRPFAA